MSFPGRWKKASGERKVLRQNGAACTGWLLTALQPQKAVSSEPLHHLGAHVSASSWGQWLSWVSSQHVHLSRVDVLTVRFHLFRLRAHSQLAERGCGLLTAART